VTDRIAFAALGGLLGSAVAAPIIYRLLLKTNSRQKISAHVPEHAAKQGTPTMGGIITLIGLLAGMGVAWNPNMLPSLVLVLGFGLAGFIDDFVVPRMMAGKRGLGWKQKFILEIGAILGAVVISGQTNPLYIFTALFVILFFSNAYNFSDGMDTLAGGLGVLICVGLLGLSSFINAELPSTPVLAAMGAAFLPFLIMNAPPAKVFMGDVGSLPFGAVMGGAVLEIGAPRGVVLPQIWPMIILISVVMLAEIIPPPLQVASAKLRKGKRLFPFRTPIHHGFQHAGWPETRVVWLFHIVQAMCVLVALIWAWMARVGIQG
jgi:phospho-N-acetylmuramoyl-pentapeptide-transferase